MRHRKLLGMLLTTAFTATMVTGAFAQDVAPVASDPNSAAQPAAEEKVQLGLSTMAGEITEVHLDEKNPSITVKNEQQEMIFYVADAYLVDSVKGTPFALKQDLVGEAVRIYYGPQVMMSIPAKSPATAVILDNSENHANFAVVESIEHNENGSVTVVTDQGSRLVTIAADAEVSPFMTKNIVKLPDIQKGAKVLLYYDIMTLSMPAQAHTSKVVLLQPAEAAEQPENTEEEMVPVKQMADSLGMDLEWNHETKTITLRKGNFSATMAIGKKEAGINKMLVMLDKEPRLINNTTYVPASFMEMVAQKLN